MYVFVLLKECFSAIVKGVVNMTSKVSDSFIHSGDLYSASSRNLLRGALSPATVKEKCLKKLAERRDVVMR